jgi:Acyclic terpene utilisation family protein AtuA
MKQKIRIGCGAGFSGDRIEPAIILAEKGNLDYLVLECLAERTITLAQKRKYQDPSKGYDPLLERRIEALLPALLKNEVQLITNMGAANPIEGAKKIIEIAKNQGVKIKVAAVLGDDISDELSGVRNQMNDELKIFGDEDFAIYLIKKNSSLMISANAYMGIEGILEALKTDADIIITGRVADPSLFLAPMIHEFGWQTDEYDLLGKGTIIGHLLECAGQVTGGYFADNDKKIVPDLANLGHPIAEIQADGSAIISKVEGTGGLINLQTVKEQLLYEVTNPYEYFTPDVIADFTSVTLQEINKNQVQVKGGTGKTKPKTLKVSVGYKAYFLGEGEISYAGHHALERAKLAGEIIEERIKSKYEEFKIDYIGLNSVHRTSFGNHENPYEIRLRVAAKAKTQEDANLVGEEVEALYTNGPAGGGGVRKYTNEIFGVVSILVDREKILPQITIFES